MYDFDKEYKALFETPLEQIKPDMFFRADNFQKEKWYGELQIYMSIGVCKTDKETVSDMQKALKVLGYPTKAKEHNGEMYLVPDNERQKNRSRRQEER